MEKKLLIQIIIILIKVINLTPTIKYLIIILINKKLQILLK